MLKNVPGAHDSSSEKKIPRPPSVPSTAIATHGIRLANQIELSELSEQENKILYRAPAMIAHAQHQEDGICPWRLSRFGVFSSLAMLVTRINWLPKLR
jgi:hypothetical protein